jgi:hypothetical protein
MMPVTLAKTLGKLGLGLVLLGLASACASPERARTESESATIGSATGASARIEVADRPLQCVPFARAESGIEIYGDAWTWWQAAKGHFRRDSIPRPGAVLVLGRSSYTSRGHLAVVTEVIGPREILVNHANWLNKGNIHRMTPVRDVSPANDWSAVRVWYTPGRQLGRRTYPADGFIHPAADHAAL